MNELEIGLFSKRIHDLNNLQVDQSLQVAHPYQGNQSRQSIHQVRGGRGDQQVHFLPGGEGGGEFTGSTQSACCLLLNAKALPYLQSRRTTTSSGSTGTVGTLQIPTLL